MRPTRKSMPDELQALQERLRAILRANMGEARRTRELLREMEQKMEEQLGHLDFIETSWYIAGKKFRKESLQGRWQNDRIRGSAEHRPARASVNTPGNAPRSTNGRVLHESPSARNVTPRR